MATADATTMEASPTETAPAAVESTAASAAMTTTERHCAGRHRRRADRDGSGERKIFLRIEVSPFDPRPPNDALGVAQSVSKMYARARAGTNYKLLINPVDARRITNR